MAMAGSGMIPAIAISIGRIGNFNHYCYILPCIIRLYVIIDYLLLSLLDTTLQMTKIISC